MKREEVEHLALLARISLSEREAEKLSEDISNIIGYVSEINEIVAEKPEKKVGAVHNVMREDGEPHEANKYTKDLLHEVPEKQGPYVKVKKILNQDE
jgi:aspartyl-tRNA(Asn)/glutamyl-tRNA(Gln) amidotransferase subunit C